jgi:hypothetical protein
MMIGPEAGRDARVRGPGTVRIVGEFFEDHGRQPQVDLDVLAALAGVVAQDQVLVDLLEPQAGDPLDALVLADGVGNARLGQRNPLADNVLLPQGAFELEGVGQGHGRPAAAVRRGPVGNHLLGGKVLGARLGHGKRILCRTPHSRSHSGSSSRVAPNPNSVRRWPMKACAIAIFSPSPLHSLCHASISGR